MFWQQVPDWATRWCDSICCNPGGDPSLGENPWHHRPVPEPKHTPEYTTSERLLLNITGAEAHLYWQTHDLYIHLKQNPETLPSDQPVLPFINACEYRTATYKKLAAHATDCGGAGDITLTDNPEMKDHHYTIVSHLWEQTGHLKKQIIKATQPLKEENRPAA